MHTYYLNKCTLWTLHVCTFKLTAFWCHALSRLNPFFVMVWEKIWSADDKWFYKAHQHHPCHQSGRHAGDNIQYMVWWQLSAILLRYRSWMWLAGGTHWSVIETLKALMQHELTRVRSCLVAKKTVNYSTVKIDTFCYLSALLSFWQITQNLYIIWRGRADRGNQNTRRLFVLIW